MKINYTIAAAFLTCILSLTFSSNSLGQNNGTPPGWEFVTTPTNPHGIIVMLEANPRINETQIQTGDYIGAFFTDDSGVLVCGGADFWLGDENIIFTANGDDPATPEKDGFSNNEQIYFKVYSWINQKEYDVDDYSFNTAYYGRDNWSSLGLSAMTNLVCNVEFDAFASATPNPVCLGDEITLSANIFAGTTNNYTYTWSSEPEGFSSTNPEILITPEQATTFFLTVSDGVLTSNHELTVEVHENPMIEAGNDMTICPTGCATIEASAQNYSSIIWESNGDGSFNNPSLTTPVYYPGETDVVNGVTSLTALANPLSACSIYASDNVGITIQSIPTITLPTNMTICGVQEIDLDANANNYSTILWTTTGDGSFSNPNSEITQYFPGTSDQQLGEFILNICATAILPISGEVCSQIHIEIIDAPTAIAPTSQSKCDNLPIPVTCIPSNYTGILWTTQGDGSFENPEAANTMYHAGAQDMLNGGTTVDVNIFGEAACEIYPVTKTITISLSPSPKVDAGDVSVLCTNQNLELNATVEDYIYFMWSTSGDGNFSNMIATNPTYYPGTNDAINGNFTLTLTAYPTYPCTVPVIDELFVEMVGQPEVDINIENHQELPAQALEISTTANNFQSINWETNGDGAFDDPSAISPIYTPGDSDATGEELVLTVTAFAASNCGVDVYDQVSILFTQMASISAGTNITVCESGAELSASSQFCSSVVWETNGDGNFSDPTAESTTYNPGLNDIQNGVAEVCINGFFGENQSVSDCITITVVPNPVIEISNTQTEICFDQAAELEVSASNYSSIFWYTTNGGGDFTSNGNTSSTYNPSPTVDYPQGCVTIFALAQPLSACSMVDEASFDLCFVANPEIEASNPQTEICYNESADLEVLASNYSSIFWYTTNGGGTFSGNGNTTNTYDPSPSVDYPQGCITIIALAQPMGACSIVDETSFDLCFVTSPEVSAGDDATITEEDAFLSAATISSPCEVLWETSGDGYFNDENKLNPEYFPGTEDINNGGVELTINATPSINCSGATSDQVDLTIHRSQTIYIPAGWSGFSSYINNATEMEEMFAPIADYLVIAQTITNVYWPEGNINTMGNFSNTDGYKIKMSEGAAITFSGNIAQTTSIELTEGWNIIPVLSSCAIDQYDFVNQFGGTMLLMKEIGGNGIIWPDLNIYNLPAVLPGRAYLVAVSQNTTVTFESCNEMKSGYAGSETPSINNSPWISPEQTTITHNVAFTAASLENLHVGDFIGAFNEEGVCVGVSEITDGNQNVAVSIFGDEAITANTEGMMIGETIEFRIYDSFSQNEIPVSVEYNSNYNASNGKFSENGLSVVENLIIKSTTIYEANTNTISLYPNPSKGMINFNADDSFANYHITISDMSGHVIIENDFVGSTQMNLSIYPKGFYVVTIKGENFYSNQKLILE